MSNIKLDNTRLDKIIDSSETARTETSTPTEKDISLFKKEMENNGEKQNNQQTNCPDPPQAETNTTAEYDISLLKKEIKTNGEKQNNLKTDRSENSRKETGNPTEKDINLFEKEMRTHGEKQGSQEQKQDNDGSQSAPSSAFESIFSMAFSSVKENSIQEITAPIPELNELTDTLVERILVSDPKSADQEIRIKLNESVLQDTEIRIIRHNDGSLYIQLNSENANSVQTLAAQQFELKTRLEKIESVPVSVEVNSQQKEENNQNKKSRGLFDSYLPNDDE